MVPFDMLVPPGPIRCFTVKDNNIGSADSEILRYRKKLTTLYNRIIYLQYRETASLTKGKSISSRFAISSTEVCSSKDTKILYSNVFVKVWSYKTVGNLKNHFNGYRK